MDPSIAAAAVGAGAALMGASLAGGAALFVERLRVRGSAVEAHRVALRVACSEFTAAIARVRSYSYALASDPAAGQQVVKALDEARAGCERLRILVSDESTQRAARLALRHVYSVWKEAETGVDPRGAQYPGVAPNARLRGELTTLYVGVRRELGVANPSSVFEDLDD